MMNVAKLQAGAVCIGLLVLTGLLIAGCAKAPQERLPGTVPAAEEAGEEPLEEAPPSGPARHNIAITDGGFQPKSFRLKSGDTVAWSNQRTEAARIIGGQACAAVSSPLLQPGETFSWTFEQAIACPIIIGSGISGEACNDNNACGNGRKCINNKCFFVSDLYDTSLSCIVKCNMDRVKVSTFHQDYPERVEQKYILPRGRLGSYAGAGALEWQILDGPDYCQAQVKEIIVPIEVKQKYRSEEIGSFVIALKPGEESGQLEHPHAELYGFTLRVDDFHQTCGRGITQ